MENFLIKNLAEKSNKLQSIEQKNALFFSAVIKSTDGNEIEIKQVAILV